MRIDNIAAPLPSTSIVSRFGQSQPAATKPEAASSPNSRPRSSLPPLKVASEIEQSRESVFAGQNLQKEKANQKSEGKQESKDKDATAPRKPNGEPLSREESEEVQRLQKRDAEVFAHENAHLAAAGPYAKGGVNYEYETGPDGKRYRVGGHVNIDTGRESDPEATIQKAQVVYRAALAPAEPSGQDRAVANAAKQMENQARQELTAERAEEASEAESEATPSKPREQAVEAYEVSAQAQTTDIRKMEATGLSLNLAA